MKEWERKDLVDPFRDWDAAYVLGSLGMDDRRVYERHLLSCGRCTNAVGEIAGIPGILMKVTPGQAQALFDNPSEEVTLEPHESNVVQSLARAAIARRHRVRQRFVAITSVAAALLMVIGIGIGTKVHSATPTNSTATIGTQVAMTQLIPNSMSVKLYVIEKKWGTQITWDCIYAQVQPDNAFAEPYELVITDKAGVSTVIATWKAIGKSAKGLVASTNVPLTRIKSIDIRDAGSLIPIVRGEI